MTHKRSLVQIQYGPLETAIGTCGSIAVSSWSMGSAFGRSRAGERRRLSGWSLGPLRDPKVQIQYGPLETAIGTCGSIAVSSWSMGSAFGRSRAGERRRLSGWSLGPLRDPKVQIQYGPLETAIGTCGSDRRFFIVHRFDLFQTNRSLLLRSIALLPPPIHVHRTLSSASRAARKSGRTSIARSKHARAPSRSPRCTFTLPR